MCHHRKYTTTWLAEKPKEDDEETDEPAEQLDLPEMERAEIEPPEFEETELADD